MSQNAWLGGRWARTRTMGWPGVWGFEAACGSRAWCQWCHSISSRHLTWKALKSPIQRLLMCTSISTRPRQVARFFDECFCAVFSCANSQVKGYVNYFKTNSKYSIAGPSKAAFFLQWRKFRGFTHTPVQGLCGYISIVPYVCLLQIGLGSLGLVAAREVVGGERQPLTHLP